MRFVCALVVGIVLGNGPVNTLVNALATESPKALRVFGPLSARNASYRMRAHLDEANHRLTASGTLTWRNLEPKPADRLIFHLYQNAFKNYASNFIVETGAQLCGEEMAEHGYGAIDVTALKVNGRDYLPAAILDDTLLSVPLQTPVGPNAIVEVQLEWTVQLPRAFARSGYSDSYHAVTQWFPKIGVFECDAAGACRWRAHQYHGTTEFFADYGVYDVDIDVPVQTVVGASGVLVAEKRDASGERRTLSYHAEDVHDFAFFTDPRFIEVNDRVDDEYGSVAVRLLTRPGHQPMSGRHLTAVRGALLEAERRLGVYPYSNVTVVIPPWSGRGSGGMEYPTIFASISLPLPSSVRAMEDVTAHEFLHQYFYGILASDEVEDAWLDEGLNETFTTWVLDRLYGARCAAVDMPWLCLSSVDGEWLAYRAATRYFPVSARGFTLPRSVYGDITYSQTAVALRTLERYLGEERMAAGLRRYAERFRFRHPRKEDFTAAMSEGAREDLSWFFRQALDSTRTADYAVIQAETRPHALAGGLWDCPPRPLPEELLDKSDPIDAIARLSRQELYRESAQAACVEPAKNGEAAPRPAGRYELDVEKNPPKTPLHDSHIVVQRRGELFFPVDISATFADGSSERLTWTLAEQQAAPESRIKIVTFPRRQKPLVRADVDPEQKLLLDENRINNSLYVEPRTRPIARLYLSLVGALHTFFDLVGV